MKKMFRKIGMIVAVCSLIVTNILNIQVIAADVTAADAFENTNTDEMVLLDQECFYIAEDGEIIQSNTKISMETMKSSSDISGSFNYYYLGKNSNKQPEYQVVLSISSSKKLKSSVLSTKAEGVTSWNNHSASHSGKTGTNTRTYSYTSSNPPSNPYCYAKATITTSDGTTYSIPSKKLTNPKSK